MKFQGQTFQQSQFYLDIRTGPLESTYAFSWASWGSCYILLAKCSNISSTLISITLATQDRRDGNLVNYEIQKHSFLNVRTYEKLKIRWAEAAENCLTVDFNLIIVSQPKVILKLRLLERVKAMIMIRVLSSSTSLATVALISTVRYFKETAERLFADQNWRQTYMYAYRDVRLECSGMDQFKMVVL